MNKKDQIDLEPLAVQLTEAARLLNVCPQTLHAYTQKGVIPHKRLGNQIILYPVDELRAWLKNLHSNGASTDRQDAALK